MAIAAAATVLGVATLAVGRVDPGLHLTTDDRDRIVIADVDPRSLAWANGIRPGMVVLNLDGVTLINLPQYVLSLIHI